MSHDPTPQAARALLAQATQTGASTRAGASWPHIAGLLGMGAASSLALPALAYVPPELVLLPLILLLVWVGALFAFARIFGRVLKRGFGRRWVITINAWGIVWVVSVCGIYFWFDGQSWFLITASAALTVVTLLGAWWEARG